MLKLAKLLWFLSPLRFISPRFNNWYQANPVKAVVLWFALQVVAFFANRRAVRMLFEQVEVKPVSEPAVKPYDVEDWVRLPGSIVFD